MAQDFRSEHWYRVAAVRPRLAPHVRVQRQRFRGEPWYVLFDPVNQRTHRLSPPAWALVARMDGRRSVEALWRESAVALGEEAPPQDEVIQLLAQLHESDMLASDAMPDLDELVRRRERQRRQRWKQSLSNPLSIRLPLWDPDAFLVRTLPALRWVFGPVGAALWLATLLAGLLALGLHWRELSGSVGDRLLSASSLLSLVLVYPLVKGLHELAHAYAARAGGAAVHELGVMFLVFMPTPYVDASGSAAFADKRARALVAAAGMMMELFLGALALGVWLLVEPGLVRSLAFAVMVAGGVSTLLFNGNPLMRYDGYFVLCDWIESPNLAQRSNQYWSWLVRRFAFGLRQAQPPQCGAGEWRWLVAYAPLAFAWRLSVTFGIALFLGQQYLYVGLAIGLWGLAAQLLWPLVKGLRYLWGSPELAGRRERPLALAGSVTAVLLAVVLALPLPLLSYAHGQVWPAQGAQLRTAEAGFVARLALPEGAAVQPGQVVALLANDQLDADQDVAQAKEERQRRGYVALLAQSGHEDDVGHARVAALVQQQEWQRAEEELRHAERRRALLAVTAQREGRLAYVRAADLPGRWLKKGESFGHVVTADAPTVRVVVGQDDIELVRRRLRRVEVRLSGDLAQVFEARLVREVPAAGQELPALALALDGGGLVPADARDPEHPRALSRVFQLDLQLPPEAAGALIGERAHVRFVHPDEALAWQLARRLRQLLLSQLQL
jgi:putative peptide zinc metalloprotease protein